MSAGTSSVLPNNTYANPIQELWTPAGGGGGGGNAGVTQIVAGTNITITPADGEGVVTINASGGSAGGVTEILTGAGISASTPTGVVTLANTGVTSLVAGPGIVLSGATGAVTVSSPANAIFIRSRYINQLLTADPCTALCFTQLGQVVTVTGRLFVDGASGTANVSLPADQIALLPAVTNPFGSLSTVLCSGKESQSLVVCSITITGFGSFRVAYSGGNVGANTVQWTLIYITNDLGP
jgi:hypothetical protein